MFDSIIANDVLEHIPNLKLAMTNCLSLLRPGGTFHIFVPYDLSLGAWQDPTHVRAFNENSWHYYTGWYWYMGWLEARFDLMKFVPYPTGFGKKLQEENRPIEEIMRTPRAIDYIGIVLRKRYLLESEITQAASILKRPFDEQTAERGA
jgi:SAM-dependent methyltransferase